MICNIDLVENKLFHDIERGWLVDKFSLIAHKNRALD